MTKKRHLKVLVAVVAIAAVVAVAVLALLGEGTRQVSGPTALNMTASPVVLSIGGSEYVFKLESGNAQTGLAYLYVEQVPVFINPILNVTLVLRNSTKVNAGSAYANMQIQLNSIGNGSISVTVTPVQSYLQEAPDSARIRQINVALGVAGSGAQNSTNKVTATTTSTSTTVGSTTTVNQTSANEARILNYSKNGIFYPLMLNYTNLYANTRNCTAPLYNSSFIGYYGHAPSGPNTYQNVSLIVPYSMSSSVSYSSKGNYGVAYATQSHNPVTQGNALVMTINLTTGTILGTVLGGVFTGSNFSTMQSGLRSAATIGNACEIYVV